MALKQLLAGLDISSLQPMRSARPGVGGRSYLEVVQVHGCVVPVSIYRLLQVDHEILFPQKSVCSGRVHKIPYLTQTGSTPGRRQIVLRGSAGTQVCRPMSIYRLLEVDHENLSLQKPVHLFTNSDLLHAIFLVRLATTFEDRKEHSRFSCYKKLERRHCL